MTVLEVFEFGINILWTFRIDLIVTGIRDACVEYAEAVEKLAFKLLELMAMSLDLPAKRLNGYFKDSLSRVRLNRYPPCPSPDLALGVGPHKDQGALTVLAQDDVGGLDVKRKSDGQWVRVKPVPDSYVINIGDLIQVKNGVHLIFNV
ncbi:uncharacterized protein A4U43_C02F16150 [Asparagus officinalis]|uniref:Fe2OG dioxygenase domain-containing protein n=1 Tax=Asparagus officinalis TaxID=4686 RepID=A0A5P1FJI2_ASPOF|nr:uncharacterized protein A4U43_C02F16150 [Asparagus officinalis]